MRTGQARDYRQSSNGNTPRRIVRSKEILSRTRIFIHARHPGQETMGAFTKCLVTFGSGRAAPTRLIQVIARRQARSANTTASSCANSTFCVAVRVQPHAVTFAALTAIFSNQKSAGSLQGSDWHAIHNKSVPRDRQACAER